MRAFIGAIKAVEYVRQIVGCDGGAGVVHAELDASYALMQRYRHLAAVACVLAGVVDKCRDQAMQARGVAHDRHVTIDFEVSVTSRSNATDSNCKSAPSIRLVRSTRSRADTAAPSVDAGEQQQVAYELLHALSFCLRAFHPLAFVGNGSFGVLQQNGRVRQNHGMPLLGAALACLRRIIGDLLRPGFICLRKLRQ